MDLLNDAVEEVDVPPNLSVELCSGMNDLCEPPLKNGNNHTKGGVANLQVSSDGLSASSSSIESLNMLLEKQRKRQLNHPQHQEFIGEPLRPQGTVKETSEIFLKYDPISKRKVLNTYEIIKELGHGQHGKVKLARDLLTKQLVAIKIVDRHEKRQQRVFRFKKSSSQTHSDKIKREIAIMKKCHYKHVVKLLEVLDDSKSRKIYLVLEYCSKGEVKWCPVDQMETEARGPPLLSFQRTREIFRGVVLGLEYLHFQGVIHRDIKPANLLISEDDTVKISDFGVSLAATGGNDDDGLESVDELELAKTAGTPAFFAPEICLGNEAFERFQLKMEDLFKGSSVSFMIDIWALGVTLYCLLFGMLPFISSYELELFEKIVNDPVKFPSYDEVKGNNISMVVNEDEYNCAIDLVDKLLHKNPMQRINIADIKKHSFTCWDFNHISCTEDSYIDGKLREIKEFQMDKEEQFKQISISRHELKNAVLGVGKKVMEPMLKILPGGRKSLANGKNKERGSPDDQGKGQDDYSDSSYIVSEGSVVSDLGNLNDFKADRPYDNHNPPGFTNGLHEKCNTMPLFKPRYSINNDNDNDNNGNDNDCYDKDNDKNKIETARFSGSDFEQELKKFDEKHDPKSMVDLPINSSFASLDSLYIDNFAMSKHGKERDFNQREAKLPSIHVRPPPLGALHIPSYVGRNNRGHPALLRNSSSQLNFLGSGAQSTREDRIPHKLSTAPQEIPNHRVFPTQRAGANETVPHGSPKTVRNGFNGRGVGFAATGNADVGTSLSESAGRKDEKSRGFNIKKGNFFSSFNGQDEESSTSSEASMSDPSSSSSCSENESDGSNAESLPFEFAVDSANASVLSMRDFGDIETVRPFMDVHGPTQRSKLEVCGRKDTAKFADRESSDDSDGSDELVLSIESSGFQRRQGSANGSSGRNSRRSTLPYLFANRDGTMTSQDDSALTFSAGSASTIVNNFNTPSQRTLNMYPGQEVKALDIPAHLSRPLNHLSSSNIATSPNDRSRSSSSGALPYANTPNSSGSLFLSRAAAKPTTQASNVGGISSMSKPHEHPQDSSRDLLKTVLISAAGSSRRKSVPCIALPDDKSAERLTKSSHEDKRSNEHLNNRTPRSTTRGRRGSGQLRSHSVSLALLGKESIK